MLLIAAVNASAVKEFSAFAANMTWDNFCNYIASLFWPIFEPWVAVFVSPVAVLAHDHYEE